jgi:hypothetical protein
MSKPDPDRLLTPLFRKLNLGDQRSIHVLNAPASFEAELKALNGAVIERSVQGEVHFALAFVTTSEGVADAVGSLVKAAVGDVLLWMVYPKTTSKRYKCGFNRDNGWAALGAAGYEAVRQVAVDEDWSALRFRKAEFVKTMSRHPAGAISPEGRKKARAHRKA